MRLDNEPIPSKQGSPQYRYMKKNIDFIEQEIAKNLKGGFTNTPQIKNNANSLVSERNHANEFLTKPGLECTITDLSLSSEDKIADSRQLNGSDKVPSELPKMLVCYNDDANAIKDICVDEEVLLKDKIAFRNEDDKSGNIKVPSVGNKVSALIKEIENDEFLSPDGSLQSSESDDDKNSQEIKCLSEKTFLCDNTSGEANCSPNITMVEGDASSASLWPDFCSQKTLMSFLLSSDYNGNELDQSTNKVPCFEATHGIPASKLAYNGNDEAQKCQGESSSSKLDSSSGRITCSGPMLIYSGSVSIRSESSSTRSFAFPILQPEWHASPVKMAKPDRRKYRKNGGWKQAITCCRF